MSTIDRIRGLLRAETTERPWRAEKDHGDWNVEAGSVEMVAGTYDGSERRRHDNARLIVELVNNAEALCDLADAARKGTTREQATNPYDECVSCRDYVDDCRCPLSDVRAALARLDGEEGTSSGSTV